MNKKILSLAIGAVNAMGNEHFNRVVNGTGVQRNKYYPLPGAKTTGAAGRARMAQKRKNKKK